MEYMIPWMTRFAKIAIRWTSKLFILLKKLYFYIKVGKDDILSKT